MSERRNNILSRSVIAARAMLSGGQSAFGAGCVLCGVNNNIMAEGGNGFLLGFKTAAFADLSLGKSRFGARFMVQADTRLPFIKTEAA